MRTFLLTVSTFFCLIQFAAASNSGCWIIRPDLAGKITQSGSKLIITVENRAVEIPGQAGGKAAHSTARLTLDGQTQTINVPELGFEGVFTKEIAIPSSLRTKLFVATLKVDAASLINESNENNNSFSANFNAPDLVADTFDGVFIKAREEGAFYYLSVKNIGYVNATGFTIKVTYKLKNNLTKVVVGVGSGMAVDGTTEVKVDAPPRDCFQPDCHFTVSIDVNGNVTELKENNNNAKGRRID